MSNIENNKRIAKNTIFLYLRMFFIMGISLYIVRILLDVLGIIDYGIYNVIAGIVTMFTFLNGTLASASQRFFAIEIGRNNLAKLNQIFCLFFMLFIGFCIIIVILAETIGLWFINNKLTIPVNRLDAANWVYQFTVITFLISMITIPYNAVILAREKMNVYAYISIIEILLKLLIVYLLIIFSFDKLITYSILIFVVTVIVSLVYIIYCLKNFNECKFKYKWNKQLFKELLTYSGWNFIGSFSEVLRNQGINLLLNIFFTPIVNAARSIAYQINSAVVSFINNYYTAVRPQITKSYAIGDKEAFNNLIIQSAKYSFYLMMIISIPVLLDMNFLLNIWLKELPKDVVLYSRLVIINSLIEIMNLPLVAAIQATGNIKAYQKTVTIILLLNLPISYIFLLLGFPPEATMIISITISILSFFPRLWICQKVAEVPAYIFFRDVLSKLLLVFIISSLIPSIIYLNMNENIYRFFFICITGLSFSLLTIYFIGLTSTERTFVINYINRKIHVAQ